MRKIIHNFLHGQLFFIHDFWCSSISFSILVLLLLLVPLHKTTSRKTCFPAQWVLPAISFSFPFFSMAVQSFRDINWPICMFQWASERKWHLQSFLFLGRERIIALHCFKAYQVSKAFHSFLGSRYYAGDDARLCRRRGLYWRYLSNLWSLYLDLTNSYWFSSSILVLVAWL